MKISEKINENSGLVSAAAILILLAALVAVAYSTGLIGSAPEEGHRQVYYMNVATNQTFAASTEEIPPITTPEGHEEAGVRAYLFTCGECKPGEWFGYLEKFSDEYKRSLADGSLEKMPPPRRADMRMESQLIRPLESERTDWVGSLSSEANQIKLKVAKTCGEGTKPTECLPTGED